MILLKKGIILFIGSSLMALQCSKSISHPTSEQIAGNGSSAGPGMVSGVLYEPGGKVPAKGALVVVRYKNATAQINSGASDKTGGALATTFTQGNGDFAFDTLDSGLYIIEGSDDKGNMAIFDSIAIDSSKKSLTLPADTLEPAGAIRGAVSLPNGGNPLQVFVLAFGVDRFCQVTSDGVFLFKGFAREVYRLKIISLDPTYGSVDTAGITVKSGDTTTIGTIELPIEKLIAPVLRLEYDTMLMEVTLSWHPTPASITKGYNIYWVSSENPWCSDSVSCLKCPINTQLYTDTTFVLGNDNSFVIGKTYKYYVVMLDVGNNVGPSSNSVSVTISSKFEAYDSVQLSLPADKPNIDHFSINKNDEFVVVMGNYVNRYSRKGELISSQRFPDFANGKWVQQINSRDSTGNCYFAMEAMDSVYNWHDSCFTMLPSGDFLKPIPLPDSSHFWQGITIINNNVYIGAGPLHAADQGIIEIKRMDLITGNIVPWKYVSYSCSWCEDAGNNYTLTLLPDGNEGILVDSICYNLSGVERFSIPNSDPIVAFDSLIVYNGGMYKISASGEIREVKTSREYWTYAAISSDKTVYTLSDSDYGKVYLRRFPE